MRWVGVCSKCVVVAQVLTGGSHALQQRRASLLCSVPDRRLLDALRRPAQRQPGAAGQTARVPAAVLARLHPDLRAMNTSARHNTTPFKRELFSF